MQPRLLKKTVLLPDAQAESQSFFMCVNYEEFHLLLFWYLQKNETHMCFVLKAFVASYYESLNFQSFHSKSLTKPTFSSPKHNLGSYM